MGRKPRDTDSDIRRQEGDREDEFRETLAPPASRAPSAYQQTSFFTAANIVYVLFGILEAILALRFIFLLFGASTANGFVNFIYGLSEPFVSPFYGIFGGIDVAGSVAIFDGTTLLAMLVYAVIGWAIIRLINSGRDRI